MVIVGGMVGKFSTSERSRGTHRFVRMGSLHVADWEVSTPAISWAYWASFVKCT